MDTDERQLLIIDLQWKTVQFGVWRTCLNCSYWRPNQKGAGPNTPQDCVKFNRVPPLKVIVVSCTSWLPVVPF